MAGERRFVLPDPVREIRSRAPMHVEKQIQQVVTHSTEPGLYDGHGVSAKEKRKRRRKASAAAAARKRNRRRKR